MTIREFMTVMSKASKGMTIEVSTSKLHHMTGETPRVIWEAANRCVRRGYVTERADLTKLNDTRTGSEVYFTLTEKGRAVL